ncbi:MAG: HNH endonuclease [Candidatus Heimdallarchaeota archaeon]
MPRRRTMRRPSFPKKQLRAIYDKTKGYCNWCGKKLAFTNYGKLTRRGSWEVDHSNPVSKGGTNYRRNLVPSCPSCNRSKGTKRRRAYRKKSWLEQILGL